MRYRVKGSFNFIVTATSYEEAQEEAWKQRPKQAKRWVITPIKPTKEVKQNVR